MRRARLKTGATAVGIALAAVALLVGVLHGTGVPLEALELGTGSLWFSSAADPAITLIEGATGARVTRVTLPGIAASDALPVAQVGASALAVDRKAGSITRVDGASWTVTGTLPVGSGADDQLDVVTGGGAAYALVQRSSQVQQIDPVHLTTVGVALPVPGRIVGKAVAGDGTLWTVNDRGEVRSYRNGTQVASTAVGSGPSATLALLGDDPVIVDLDAGRATQLDGATGENPRPVCFDAPTSPAPLIGTTSRQRHALMTVTPEAGTLIVSTADAGCRTITLGPIADHARYGAPVERDGFAYVPDLDSHEVVVANLDDTKQQSKRVKLPLSTTFRLVAASDHIWFDELAPGERAGVITEELTAVLTSKGAGDDAEGDGQSAGDTGPVDAPGNEGQPDTNPSGDPTNPSNGTNNGSNTGPTGSNNGQPPVTKKGPQGGATTTTTKAGPKAKPTAVIQVSPPSAQVKVGKPITLKDGSSGSTARVWTVDGAGTVVPDKTSQQITVTFNAAGAHDVGMQATFASGTAPATQRITVTPLDQVAVPDVRGLSVGQATAAITGAGLSVGTQKPAYSLLAGGTVSGSTPSTGTTVTEGSAVELDVSNGIGNVSQLAGTGQVGTAALPNGSLATGAALGNNEAVLLDTDAAGNTYFGFRPTGGLWQAYRIDRATNAITMVAEGSVDLQVDGAAVAPNGTIWVSSNFPTQGAVGILGSSGMTFTLPISAGPHFPRSLAIAPNGDVYIADTGRSHIDRWDGTQSISVVGDGTEPVGANCPGGNVPSITPVGFVTSLAVDGAGNVVFATNRGCISMYTPGNTTTTPIGGTATNGIGTDGGDARQSAFDSSNSFGHSLAFDGRGGVLVANGPANRIRRIDLASGIVTRFAGTGSAGFSGVPGGADQVNVGDTTMVAVRPDDLSPIFFTNSTPRILLVQ